MATSTERKLLNLLAASVSDIRFNPAHFATMINSLPFSVQTRIFDTVLQMIKFWALDWEGNRFDLTPRRVAEVSNALWIAYLEYKSFMETLDSDTYHMLDYTH